MFGNLRNRLILIAVLLVAAASLFSGLTIRSTLRAAALPLLLGGAIVLAGSWLAGPVLSAAVNAARTSVTAAGGVPALVAVGGSLATAMVDQVQRQVVPTGVALIAVGLVLLLVRTIAKRA